MIGALNVWCTRPPTGPIERMVAISQTVARVRQSEDLREEGIAAHQERRKPMFKGR